MIIRLLTTLAAISLMVSCVDTAPAAVLERSQRYVETVNLPESEQGEQVFLGDALANRRSQREFESSPVPMEVVGQLLWSAQGVTDAEGHRTAPSAGARYPLEVYAITTTQIMHYLPADHAVEVGPNLGVTESLAQGAFGQDWIASAPVVVVIAGLVERTEAEYGAVATRLMDREAGHAAQNVLLTATGLGLASVPVGGFDPAQIRSLLALPRNEEPLYLIPIGWPA